MIFDSVAFIGKTSDYVFSVLNIGFKYLIRILSK